MDNRTPTHAEVVAACDYGWLRQGTSTFTRKGRVLAKGMDGRWWLTDSHNRTTLNDQDTIEPLLVHAALTEDV